MNPLQIDIGDEKYEYINSITYQNKKYIAFTDFQNVYIKEYINSLEDIEILDIDDQTFKIVKEMMNL